MTKYFKRASAQDAATLGSLSSMQVRAIRNPVTATTDPVGSDGNRASFLMGAFFGSAVRSNKYRHAGRSAGTTSRRTALEAPMRRHDPSVTQGTDLDS